MREDPFNPDRYHISVMDISVLEDYLGIIVMGGQITFDVLSEPNRNFTQDEVGWRVDIAKTLIKNPDTDLVDRANNTEMFYDDEISLMYEYVNQYDPRIHGQ